MNEGTDTSYASRLGRTWPDGPVTHRRRFRKVAVVANRWKRALVPGMAVLPVFVAVVLGCSILSAGTAQARDVSHSAVATSSTDSLAVTRLASSLSVANTDSQPVAAGHETSLLPLAQSEPHTRPVTPITHLRPHTDVTTNGGLNLTTNWSGLIDTGGGALFTGVQGDWVVPAVQSSASDEASATWIGIDDQADALIQTGIAQNSGPGYGGTQYYAWVEMLPASPGVIGLGSSAAPVEPGDAITSSISETSLGLWTVDIADATQNWSFSQQFSYSSPGLTAEWIEEAPAVNGSVSALANYGSATFTNLGVAGSGDSSASLYPTYMASSSGAIISYPGDYNGSTDSFSTYYGSPSPQVTSGARIRAAHLAVRR